MIKRTIYLTMNLYDANGNKTEIQPGDQISMKVKATHGWGYDVWVRFYREGESLSWNQIIESGETEKSNVLFKSMNDFTSFIEGLCFALVLIEPSGLSILSNFDKEALGAMSLGSERVWTFTFVNQTLPTSEPEAPSS